jgi:membrane-bound serine protease (ClpP class)
MRLSPPALALVTAVMLGVGVMALPAGQASAQEGRHIDVVQVEGAIDPPMADLVVSSIEKAQTNGASLVVLQVDSPGALDVDPVRLLEVVRASRVPVLAWVGPTGASARGAAAALVVAAVGAVSPGSRIGPVFPLRLDRPGEGFSGLVPGLGRDEAGRRLSARQALDAGLVDYFAPTLGELIVSLDGQQVSTAAGPVRLSTARVVATDKGPRQTPNQPVRFLKLGTVASVQHSLASPAVAYLLLVVGLALMVFEFYTAGIGLAAASGAGALAAAFYGFSHLPVHSWAVALVFLSAFGFAVDVQAGVLAFWTGVGVVALVAGSLGLTAGSSLLDVPLWLVVLVVVGQTAFMVWGMTTATRARFSVPTVGRDSMIGEVGEARTALAPEGVVVVRGAPWRARTGRGRPVEPGGSVRVVAVDHLVLEVEPASTPEA